MSVAEFPAYTMDELRFDMVHQLNQVTYVDVSARATRYRVYIVDVSALNRHDGWLVTVANHPVPAVPIPNLDPHWAYLVEKMRDEHVGRVVALVLERLAELKLPGRAELRLPGRA